MARLDDQLFKRLTTSLAVSALLLACASRGCGVGVAAAREFRVCVDVFTSFYRCARYLAAMPSVDEPLRECCSGMKELKRMAKLNRSAPSQICQCIEDITRVLSIPLDVSRIQSLPIKCNTTLSFPISIAMDCSKV